MALFGRGYDRDYDLGYRRGASRHRERSGMWGEPPYGGYDAVYGRGGGWSRAEPGRGYDWRYARPYKSRWQTDYGDPFGDREQGTPFRVIREEGSGRRDRGMWGSGYGGDYRRTPAGYQMYDRMYRRGPQGYDSDWF